MLECNERGDVWKEGRYLDILGFGDGRDSAILGESDNIDHDYYAT